jgi:hypothetical protein
MNLIVSGKKLKRMKTRRNKPDQKQALSELECYEEQTLAKKWKT